MNRSARIFCQIEEVHARSSIVPLKRQKIYDEPKREDFLPDREGTRAELHRTIEKTKDIR